jgi:prophage regulatory protein
MISAIHGTIPTAPTPLRPILQPAHTVNEHGLITSQHIQGGEQLLRLPQLKAVLGISRATIYRYVDSGKLPPPVKLSSRCVAWRASAINEWMATLNR